MNRSVIVASPSANVAKKIENFTGTTWGELRANPVVGNLWSKNLEAVLSPGNVTLKRDDAQLPEGDFKVFLIVTKNDAGTISPADAQRLGQQISQAIVAASNQASEGEIEELKNSLLDTINDFFDTEISVDQDGTSEPSSELSAALQEARRFS